MSGVALPPSPNWYGAHLADWDSSGQLYAYAAHNSLVLLCPGDKRVEAILSEHTNRVTALCFAPRRDGRLLLLSGAADRCLRSWDADQHRALRVVRKQPAEVSGLAVSRTGDVAAVGDRQGNLFAWHFRDGKGKPRRLAQKLRSPVFCMAASPAADSQVAVGCEDGSTLLIDFASGQMLASLAAHQGEVHCLAYLRLPQASHQRNASHAAALSAPGQRPLGAAQQAPSASQQAPSIACLHTHAAPTAQQAAGSPVAQISSGPTPTAESFSPNGLADAPEQPADARAAPYASAQALQLQDQASQDLLVCGSQDRTLHVYDVRSEPAGAVKASLLCTLSLPKPPGALSKAQRMRLWMTAAWLPPSCQADPDFAWLVTSGYGGSTLAWQVPRQAGAAVAPPVRIPGGHTRSVFSIRLASPATDQPSQPAFGPLPGSDAGQTTGSRSPDGQVTDQPSQPAAGPLPGSAAEQATDSSSPDKQVTDQPSQPAAGPLPGSGAEQPTGSSSPDGQDIATARSSVPEQAVAQRGSAASETATEPPAEGKVHSRAAGSVSGATEPEAGVSIARQAVNAVAHDSSTAAAGVPATGMAQRLLGDCAGADTAQQPKPDSVHDKASPGPDGRSNAGLHDGSVQPQQQQQQEQQQPQPQHRQHGPGGKPEGPAGEAPGSEAQENRSAASHTGSGVRQQQGGPGDEGRTCEGLEGSSAASVAGSASSDGRRPKQRRSGRKARLVMTTTAMDRSVLTWHIPLPAQEASWKQAKVAWQVSGLGAYAYSLQVSLLPPFQVAVGCGDKTIRVWESQAPKQPARSLPAGHSQPSAHVAAAIPGEHDHTSALPGPDQLPAMQPQEVLQSEEAVPDRASQPSAVPGPSTGTRETQHRPASSVVDQAVPAASLLLWQGITDKVTAVAWHPLHASVLAFGCDNGTVGVFDVKAQKSAMFAVRHAAPVLELSWQQGLQSPAGSAAAQATPPPQQQQQPGEPASAGVAATQAMPQPQQQQQPGEQHLQAGAGLPDVAVTGGGRVVHDHLQQQQEGRAEKESGTVGIDAAGNGHLKQQVQQQPPEEPQGGAGPAEPAVPPLALYSLCSDGRILRWAPFHPLDALRGVSNRSGGGWAAKGSATERGLAGPSPFSVKPVDFRTLLLTSPAGAPGSSAGAVPSAAPAVLGTAPASPGTGAGQRDAAAAAVSAMAWSPDGCRVALGSVKGTVEVYTRVAGPTTIHAAPQELQQQQQQSQPQVMPTGLAVPMPNGLPRPALPPPATPPPNGLPRPALPPPATPPPSGLARPAGPPAGLPPRPDGGAGQGLSPPGRLGPPVEAWRLSRTYRRQSQAVNQLRWHPRWGEAGAGGGGQHQQAAWVGRLASASDDGCVVVYPRETSPDQAPEDLFKLQAGAGAALALAWSPHHPDMLAFAAADCSVQVCRVGLDGGLQVIGRMLGHAGRVRSIAFHPTIPQVLLTGSEDQTVRVWDCTDPQHDPASPRNQPKARGLGHQAASTASDTPRHAHKHSDAQGPPAILPSKTPPSLTGSPPAPTGQGAVGSPAAGAETLRSAAMAGAARSAGAKADPQPIMAARESATSEAPAAAPAHAPDEPGLVGNPPEQAPVPASKQEQQRAQPLSSPGASAGGSGAPGQKDRAAIPAPGGDEPQAGRGLKKLRKTPRMGAVSLLPVQAVTDDPTAHQAARQACLQYAARMLPSASAASAAGPAARAMPAELAALDVYVSPLAASAVLRDTAEAISTSGARNTEALRAAQQKAVVQMWRGDVAAALQAVIEADALNAGFVSMSVGAGRAVWREVVGAYAAQLEAQGDVHLAASHLLSAHDPRAAVEVYRRAGLLRDAITLASASLLPQDPLLRELHCLWASQLEEQGSFEAASANYLAGGSPGDAVVVMAKRGTLDALTAAARLAAQVCAPGGSFATPGLRRLGKNLALQAGRGLLAQGKFREAERVLSSWSGDEVAALCESASQQMAAAKPAESSLLQGAAGKQQAQQAQRGAAGSTAAGQHALHEQREAASLGKPAQQAQRAQHYASLLGGSTDHQPQDACCVGMPATEQPLQYSEKALVALRGAATAIGAPDLRAALPPDLRLER